MKTIQNLGTNRPRRRTTGFSLMELMLVLAIMGILMALLLPAVQSSRESARRMDCSNKLRQLGLAANHYHSAHRSFPPGYLGSVPPVPVVLGRVPLLLGSLAVVN